MHQASFSLPTRPLQRLDGQCGQPCGSTSSWNGLTRSASPSHCPTLVITCHSAAQDGHGPRPHTWIKVL